MNPNDNGGVFSDIFEQIRREQEGHNTTDQPRYTAPNAPSGTPVFAGVGESGQVFNSSGVLIGSFEITGYAA
jgi:hypothetical protein